MRNTYKNFISNPQEKGPLGRPRHKWEDIGMDLTETCGLMHLAQKRDQSWALVNIVMNLQVP
jgi:hypothetical protein